MGATAEAKPSFLARECHELLEVALIATHAQEPVFKATGFEMRFKLSMAMRWLVFALRFQLPNQGGVAFL